MIGFDVGCFGPVLLHIHIGYPQDIPRFFSILPSWDHSLECSIPTFNAFSEPAALSAVVFLQIFVVFFKQKCYTFEVNEHP